MIKNFWRGSVFAVAFWTTGIFMILILLLILFNFGYFVRYIIVFA